MFCSSGANSKILTFIIEQCQGVLMEYFISYEILV